MKNKDAARSEKRASQHKESNVSFQHRLFKAEEMLSFGSDFDPATYPQKARKAFLILSEE